MYIELFCNLWKTEQQSIMNINKKIALMQYYDNLVDNHNESAKSAHQNFKNNFQ